MVHHMIVRPGFQIPFVSFGRSWRPRGFEDLALAHGLALAIRQLCDRLGVDVMPAAVSEGRVQSGSIMEYRQESLARDFDTFQESTWFQCFPGTIQNSTLQTRRCAAIVRGIGTCSPLVASTGGYVFLPTQSIKVSRPTVPA